MVFPVTLSVKLKCGRVSIAVPVTSKTTVSELKTSFIEAIGNSLEDMRETGTITDEDSDPPTVNTIKLFKQSEDEQGEEKWIPLDDEKLNVDKAGLDQGHIVGVSFIRNGLSQSLREADSRIALAGEYSDPVITTSELE